VTERLSELKSSVTVTVLKRFSRHSEKKMCGTQGTDEHERIYSFQQSSNDQVAKSRYGRLKRR